MRRDRALWIALAALVLAYLAFQLHQRGPGGLGWWPGCLFRRCTGLYCPGCGMTRAVHAALHGHWGEAFRFNPLGMALLPLAALGMGLQLWGWVMPRPLPFRLSLGVAGTWALAATVIGYWVLRNLPWWPFTLLAPA